MLEDDIYADDNTNINLDEDYFDPNEDADQRDLAGIIALAEHEDI
jgi:hypothetical protein